jgi:NAD(P)-dependent dehydrogenase (short-subunit alcohol dehydrogenase family)
VSISAAAVHTRDLVLTTTSGRPADPVPPYSLPFRSMPLSGRTILVTGASSGIGRGLCAAYAAAGARVFATGRNESELATTLADLGDGVAVAVVADLTTAAGRRAVATAISHAGGTLDVVVHAAGLLGPPEVPLGDYPETEWRSVFEVNVTSVHLLHQLLVPFLEAAPQPAIIGLSSTVGREGRAGWGMYAVSKHALEGWLATLAEEFKGKVFSVNPGGTRTPMRAVAVPDEDPETLPTPADIAPIFLRLAHPDITEPTGGLFDARDWIDSDPWEGLTTEAAGSA